MLERSPTPVPTHAHTTGMDGGPQLASDRSVGVVEAALPLKLSFSALFVMETSVLRMQHAWPYTTDFAHFFSRKIQADVLH